MNSDVQWILRQLRSRTRPPLAPQSPWNQEISKKLQKAELSEPTRAALCLWNDDLDTAHHIAQQIDTSTGSLIHGVMHRRQGDYSNSKYWFHRIASHPVFDELRREFAHWDPFEFVDQCRNALGKKKTEDITQLEKIQTRELEAITHYCLKL